MRADGVCDESTWSSLVEASWSLGDRHLYLRSPNLRGDDVADLQSRLGRWGFDAGRVDGIFGPGTAKALRDFQQNVGLQPDGIFGYETHRALQRLSGRALTGPAIAEVREHESLLGGSRELRGKRVVVGHGLGLGALGRAVSRSLRWAGAAVLVTDAPDDRSKAGNANRFAANAYIGLAAGADEPLIAYYETDGFVSTGGRHLAWLLHSELSTIISQLQPQPRGMRTPALRETRMPAVICDLGELEPVVHATAAIAIAVGNAVGTWASTPPA